MSHTATEPDLHVLMQRAEAAAKSRQEDACTAHLLAALAEPPGRVAELLAERRFDRRALAAPRALPSDTAPTVVADTLRKARELAARLGAGRATGPHLLLALLGDRRAGANELLRAAGVDGGRLRAAALQVAQGLVARRRAVVADAATTTAEATPRAPARRPTGVALPTVPDVGAPPSPARRRAMRQQSGGDAGPEAVSPLAPAVDDADVASAQSAAALAEEPALSALTAPLAAVDAAPRATAPRRGRAAAAPARRRPPGDFELDPARCPTLTALGRNLSALAARGELDPVVGRAAEIERALDVLAKRHGNNPVFTGAPGVGKTTVVRGLATRIVAAQEVAGLDDRILVELPLGELLAGTGVRGALAERFAAIRAEVLAMGGRVVLFFDELHQLLLGDAAEELGADLRLSLARGELPCVGASSTDDWRKVLASDGALARRFSEIELEEPSSADSVAVLCELAPRFAAHHQIRIEPAALEAAVEWSVRYLPGRALPDKAVSLVDLASARARRRGLGAVDRAVLAEVVAETAAVPVERLLETDGERMLGLEALLAGRVVGHEEPLRRIARILRRNAAGLGSRRPLGTFLLLGPSGVGKTETAKALAQALFHDEGAMTRVDLSEYAEAHSVARLIGAPPGYVGHDAGGQLTEAVRRRPYQILLLDEIEKAHPDVLLTFLPLFDEGRLTDGRGRTVDFCNTVVLLTSNLGASVAAPEERRRVGFGARSETVGGADAVVAAARAALPPELFNRLDEVLAYRPLGRDDVREIARRLLDALGDRLDEQRGLELRYDDAVIEALLEGGGFDPALGARPLKRTIARLVEAPLAEAILSGELGEGDAVVLAADAGGIAVTKAVTSSAARGSRPASYPAPGS